jgi:hypothetical protein
LVVLTVIGGVGFGPHGPDDFDALAQHADPLLWGSEVKAVTLVLMLVPTRTDTEVKTSTADYVDGRRNLGDDRRVAVRIARHHLSEPNSTRALADRSHHGPALKHRRVNRLGDVVKVVVDPHRIEAEFFGQNGEINGALPLDLRIGNILVLAFPTLRNECAEGKVRSHTRTLTRAAGSASRKAVDSKFHGD